VKLLAGEGVDARVVSRLRSEGHDVTYVAELAPEGKAELVSDSLRKHGHEIAGAFTVVSPGLVRIRRRFAQG